MELDDEILMLNAAFRKHLPACGASGRSCF